MATLADSSYVVTRYFLNLSNSSLRHHLLGSKIAQALELDDHIFAYPHFHNSLTMKEPMDIRSPLLLVHPHSNLERLFKAQFPIMPPKQPDQPLAPVLILHLFLLLLLLNFLYEKVAWALPYRQQ